jgi:hypothetical protein
MINRAINLNKKLTNDILIGLLLGSSMAISTQVQASQRLFPLSEREKREIREKKQQEDEAAEKRSGWTKAEWEKIPPEERAKIIETHKTKRKEMNEKHKKNSREQDRKNIAGICQRRR